jgi:hypothetical protein
MISRRTFFKALAAIGIVSAAPKAKAKEAEIAEEPEEGKFFYLRSDGTQGYLAWKVESSYGSSESLEDNPIRVWPRDYE